MPTEKGLNELPYSAIMKLTQLLDRPQPEWHNWRALLPEAEKMAGEKRERIQQRKIKPRVIANTMVAYANTMVAYIPTLLLLFLLSTLRFGTGGVAVMESKALLWLCLLLFRRLFFNAFSDASGSLDFSGYHQWLEGYWPP